MTHGITDGQVEALISRSNRLGADPRNTNYAGGNTSAKGTATDPVTGEDVELLWVKGSGGDLGTLTAAGLAVLRLDRLRALPGVYPGVDREDEMVAAFDFCLHGRGGAAPSIDTAMHALVGQPHVDHLHPDSGIALATAAGGEKLTAECFGDRVVWVPWRRPGFQLGLDIAAIAAANPQAIGCILGGHGITAWGGSSGECEARSLEIIRSAAEFIAANGRPDPFGPVIAGYEPLPAAQRRARAAALAPVIRGLASADRPQVGHYTDTEVVLDFVSRAEHPRLAALGTSCPDHFLRTKVRPMVLDLPPDAPLEEVVTRLGELHAAYRADYAAYYHRYATPGLAADARRRPGHRAGARRRDVQLRRQPAGRPGGRGILRQRDQRDARRRGPVHVRANRRVREVPDRVLGPGGGQAGPDAQAQAAGHPDRAGHRRGVRHRPGHRAAAVRRGRVRGGGRPRRRRAAAVAAEIGGPDFAIACTADVTDEEQVAAAVAAAALAFGGVDLVVNNAGLSVSKPLLETTVADWDLQHDVMARGSFLVSREAVRAMRAQRMGGDIVYICSKNSVVAGPDNLAYGAAKADQAHQVRLLAAELGGDGIRVNGINPDGVVRGSGIFAGGWGAKRAAVYGVAEQDLGAYYAQRTLLKREVLPSHVADAVFALTGGDLSQTTGLHIPVDSGVAAGFLR